MNTTPRFNKHLLSTILGCILVISFVVGIVYAYQKNDNLTIFIRGWLLVFSILYTYGNFSRYRSAKQSDQS